MRKSKTVFLGIAVVAIAAAMFIIASRPESCDGLPRSIGACDSNRPTFEGGTCAEVAREWGEQLDRRVVGVLNGPDSSGGKGRSSLLYDAETLVSQLANKHLRDASLTSGCEIDGFLAIGLGQMSDETIGGVGEIMFEGQPVVAYSDWESRLRTWVELMLDDPEAPYDPASGTP